MCFLIQKNSKAGDFRLYRVQLARIWKDATRSIRFTLHNLLRVFDFKTNKNTSLALPKFFGGHLRLGGLKCHISNGAVGERVAFKG